MKIKKTVTIIALSILTTLSLAQQNLYKCVNKGKTTYSNDEKDKNCQQIEIKEINRFNTPKANIKETTQETSKNENSLKEEITEPKIQKQPQKKLSKLYTDSIPGALKILGLK